MDDHRETKWGAKEIGEIDVLDRRARPILLILGLLLLGGGVALGLYISGIPAEPISTSGIIFCCVLALPGLAVIVFTVYAQLSDMIFGKLQVEVTPRKLRIGEELTVGVTFAPNFRGRIGGVFATVRAVEQDTSSTHLLWQWFGRVWFEAVRYEKRLTLSRGTEILSDGELRWSRSFTLPRGVPATYDGARKSVEWAVGVRVSIAWWPDLRRRKGIAVTPHR